MTSDKLWSILERYDQELATLGILPVEFSEIEYNIKSQPFYGLMAELGLPIGTNAVTGSISRIALLQHCRWMAQKCLRVFRPEFEVAWTAETQRYGWMMSPDMAARIEKAREPLEKAMRWLCYIQGACNAVGVYSCNELRDHSRSTTTVTPPDKET